MGNKKKKNNKVTKVNENKKKKKRAGTPFLIKFFAGLGYWLKSWFSNDRCIEAREKRGYIPFIITVASIVIAALPILSTRLSIDVGTVLDTPTYGLDASLASFQYEATTAGVELNIANNKLESFNNFDQITNGQIGSGETAISYWAHSYQINKLVETTDSSSSEPSSSESAAALRKIEEKRITVYDLLVFNATGTNASGFATNVLVIGNDPNTWYTSAQTIFATNAMIFGDDYLYFYKATEGATSATSATIYYDSPSFQGKNIIALINELAGVTPTSSNYYTTEYKSAVVSGYKSFFVSGYETSKVSNAWAYTGIATIVNVAMILVFGLMVFLMTRGKNNPYRDYKFLECYKIVGWATFSPALLSLIAFIPAIGSSAIGLLIFVLLLGLRTMWLSMKNLRPSY